MKKIKLVCLIVLCILIGVGSSTKIVKADSSSGVGTITEFNELDGDAAYLNEKYRDNYYLDIEKTGILDTGDKVINDIANILFSFIKFLAVLVVSTFYFTMDFDIVALIEPQLNAIQKALNTSVFKPLFVIAFMGTAFIIIKRMIKRDMAGALTEVLKVIGIVALSFFVVNESATALSGCTNITKSISVNALNGINSSMGISGDGNSYAATAAGVLWVNLIHEPWKTLEFGNSNPTEEEMNAFLNETPGSEKRKELVKSYKDDSTFSKGKGGSRIGFLLVYLIPFIIKSAIYLLVALIQLVFQLLAVFFLITAPVILLLALVPGYETNIISIWLRKMLETQVSILIITFLMALLIKMDQLLYTLAGTYGWLVVLVLQTAIAVGLFFGRNKILSAFSGMQKGVMNPSYIKSKLAASGNLEAGVRSAKSMGSEAYRSGREFLGKVNDHINENVDKFVATNRVTRPVSYSESKVEDRKENTEVQKPEVQRPYAFTRTSYYISTSNFQEMWEAAEPIQTNSSSPNGTDRKKVSGKSLERPRSQSEPIKTSSSSLNGTDRKKAPEKSQERPQSIQDDSHKVVREKDTKGQIERPRSQSEPIQKSSSSPNGTDRKKVIGRS
ncbi:CD3337/EF1877 family mobilome membrane protein, partial [Anaeromicropila populeti]